MTLAEIVNSRIRERLAALGKSASAVSQEAGLGRSAVQSILSGNSESPRIFTLHRLTKPLECTLSYLIGESEDPRKHADHTMARTIDEFPEGSIEFSRFVAMTDTSSFWTSDVDTDSIPPDDRVAVRDLRYPDVPVILFQSGTDRFWESGIAKNDVLTVLSLQGRSDIAVGHDDFIVIKEFGEGGYRYAIHSIQINNDRLLFGSFDLRQNEHSEGFRSLVFSGNKIALILNPRFSTEPYPVEIVGPVIRAMRTFKRPTTF